MCYEKISVLMSVYYKDNPQWLKEAIESVIKQTVKPSQIVLVIGSDLEKIISEYGGNSILEFNVLRLAQNSCLGIAIQECLKTCKYDLVARMDSDDISLPNRFESQLNELHSNKNLSILSGYVQEINCDTKKELNMIKVSNSEIKKYIKIRSPLNNPSVMFKKSKIIEAGSYQAFTNLQDYHL